MSLALLAGSSPLLSATHNPAALNCTLSDLKNSQLTIEPDLKRAHFVLQQTTHILNFDKIEKGKLIFQTEPNSKQTVYTLTLESRKLSGEMRESLTGKEKTISSKVRCKKK